MHPLAKNKLESFLINILKKQTSSKIINTIIDKLEQNLKTNEIYKSKFKIK
jgi:hypothetical protein